MSEMMRRSSSLSIYTAVNARCYVMCRVVNRAVCGNLSRTLKSVIMYKNKLFKSQVLDIRCKRIIKKLVSTVFSVFIS